MKNFVTVTTCLVIIWSCNSTSSVEEGAKGKDTTTVPPATLMAGYSGKVSCLADPSQSYEVYVPLVCEKKTSCPVIFIFDPHAKGKLPVELYRELAAKFGYVLVASNNSKNGQDPETGRQIYNTLLQDISKRLSIDSRSIYAMGFSGGSRVASAVAVNPGGIAGVIGCSAGFNPGPEDPAYHFSYAGIAGNEDFNLMEMKALDRRLQDSPMRHQLFVFNGGHEWAPAETMKEAFYWITFDAMRNQIIPFEEGLVRDFLEQQDSLIGIEVSGNGNPYTQYLIYKKILNFLEGLTDVSTYASRLNQFEHADMIRAYEGYLNRITKEEERLQNQYRDYMVSREPAWWQAEVSQLQRSIRKDKKPEEAVFKKRLLGYMSLLAYMYSNNALNSNQLDAASKYLKIYAIVDPPNSEHAYLTAVLMMKYNNPGLALSALKEAVRLGFEDRERALREPVFSGIQADTGFISALKEAK